MTQAIDPDAAEEVRTLLPTAILNGLDAMITVQPEMASRDEAIRQILREWLQAKGYMRDPDARACIRPQDLSSANDG